VDTVHECDGRTDRQTDRITITKTVQRIASHGNNRVTQSSPFTDDVLFQFVDVRDLGTIDSLLNK